jgi:hypothetical protein
MSPGYVIVDVSTDTPLPGTNWRSAYRSLQHDATKPWRATHRRSSLTFPAICYRQANEGSADP